MLSDKAKRLLDASSDDDASYWEPTSVWLAYVARLEAVAEALRKRKRILSAPCTHEDDGSGFCGPCIQDANAADAAVDAALFAIDGDDAAGGK